MARDTSRRPTPRQKAGAPTRPARAPLPRKGRADGRVPRPRAAGPRLSERPARSAPAGGRASLGDALSGVVRRPAAPASGREQRQRHQRAQTLRIVARAAAGALALVVVAVVAFLVLRGSSAFAIRSIEVEPTEHVTQADIQNLVQVPEGSTLLNVDTAAIEAALRQDPWVASVSFESVFPDTLRISITEQRADALVVMSTGSLAWFLGDAGVWIQPTRIEVGEGQSVNDAALAVALEKGCLLVTDVPATVNPAAGAKATDEVLEAVEAFREGFSDAFSSQVVRYSASSPDGVSCTLESGVEVLLGAAEDISTKEQVVTACLEKYAGKVLYVNVRDVDSVVVRPVDSDRVQSGTGVVGA